MVSLTVLNNPFNPNDKQVSEIYAGTAIFHYINLQAEDIEYVVSLNGRITEDYSYVLRDNDHLGIVPIPAGGGGGKNILRIVAMVALVMVAPQAGFAAQAALSASYGAAIGAAGYMGAYYAAYAGVMIGGSMLINALLPPVVESVDVSSSLEETSSTYSFSGGSNATAAGSALPIMLGKARVVPPIIGSYLSADGDKQYLNVLMAVNDGEVDSISDIYINDQSQDNYESISITTRNGTNTQTEIDGFRDTSTTVSTADTLNNNIDVEYTTVGNAVNELEIAMNLSSGHFKIEDNGDYKLPDSPISFRIEYKRSSSSTYTTFRTVTLGTVYKTSKRLIYTIEGLAADEYDIKITRLSSYTTDSRVANSLQFEYINEVVYTDFTYPNTALLRVKALSTEQLSGSFPTISCLVDNRYGSGLKNKSNPAWACYDLLKREGIADSDINLDEFQVWADWCDEESFTCNLYLDTQQELQSALNMVSVLGRAMVVQTGGKFTPIISKVVDIPTQSFLFTGGNIIKDSFSLDYIPHKDRANVIDVTYYDEDDDYNSKTVQVQSEFFDSASYENKSSVTLYGCTNRTIATRYAQFLLNQNRYITETVAFEADVDAIACQVGDVIKVGVKYFTNTSADGRITGATNNTINLDCEVYLDRDTDYQIEFRTSDDGIYYEDLPSSRRAKSITTDTLTFDSLSKIPAFGDVFAIGELSTEATNTFRVSSITRASDMKRKITALEYNASVYDDNTPIEVEEVIILDQVTNLTAQETLIQRIDGGVDEVLSLSWQGNSLTYTIYLDGKKIGTTDTNSFIIKNDELIRDKTYNIRVNGTAITYRFEGRLADVEAVKNFKITLLDENTVLSWDSVPFASGYRLYFNGNLIENKINATTYSFKTLSNGLNTFGIEALNIGDAPSELVETQVNVEVPFNPVINVFYDGENIVLDWQETNSTYSIKHYIITHNDLTTISKTTTYKTKVNWLTNTLSIQAVDINNNVSDVRTVNSIIEVPEVNGITSKVIDNNVLLYWEYIENTLPIQSIEIKKGDDYNTAETIGYRVGTFTTLFETLEGFYTYWFTPIDTAGNRGEVKATTAYMSEPPDYVLNIQWYSDFSGTKNNCVIDGDDRLVMGISTTETYQDHFINNNNDTIQDQLDSGYPYYLQPNLTNSYYEEVFDYGAIIGATGITVILTKETIGDVNYQIDISVSSDNSTWTDYTDTSKILEANFRYVKVKISTTSDTSAFMWIDQLEIRLDSKIKNDGGNGTSSATLPTTVQLTKSFTDVASLIVTAKGTTAKTAIYDFIDAPYPTSFDVYVFDSNGNQISSDFSWTAKGY